MSTVVAGGVVRTAGAAEMWSPVFEDEFDGTTLDPRWSPYDGTPSSDPRTRWTPARVSVGDGMLTLGGEPVGTRWNTGAVSNWRNAMTYGRWQVRFRSMRHDVLSYHFLLWPKSESWPPEIDFAESFDGARRAVQGFVHWRDAGGVRQKTQRTIEADFEQWHTVGVEWTPTEVRYTLDGEVWGVVTGEAVPREPMWLAMQVETQVCGTGGSCTASAAPVVQVDRVRVDALVASSPLLPVPIEMPAPVGLPPVGAPAPPKTPGVPGAPASPGSP